MSSVVDICNKALDKLGQNPISSLEDGTKLSSLCNRNWPIIRDQALRAYPWNFAIGRVATAPKTNTPEFGFSYAHDLPSDFLRVIEIKDIRPDDYVIEGGEILTNESVIYLRYVRRIEDPNKYDALFIDAVASLMAYELCESITQSNTKKNNAMVEYEDRLAMAKRIDGLENPVSMYEEDEWIEVRY